MNTVLLAIAWTFVAYLVLLHLGQVVLNLRAIPRLRRRLTLQPVDNLPPPHPELELPVSVVVSVGDEEATIVAALRALLLLDYSEFEVIAVIDGAGDRTLEVLQHAFALEAFPEAHWRRIPTRPVRAIYRSRTAPNLRVIDKEHGGEADAVNVGINASRYPLFFAVDTATILLRDGLRRLAEPFLDDPAALASRSALRVANGSQFGPGELQRAELPSAMLARLQMLEALRAFRFGRLGPRFAHAAPIAAEAVGIFRKDPVLEAGGFRKDIGARDVELLVRLHGVMARRGEEYSVHFVPDPVCWRQVPESLGTLMRGCVSRQAELAACLHRKGFVIPLLAECYAPLLEIAAYLFVAAMFALGQISGATFVAYLALAFALGFLASVSGMLLEEMSFNLHPRFEQLERLVITAMVDNLGYRQLQSIARARGLARWAAAGLRGT
ncbi:MAG: glycosyltransferase family 2 protein [Usitatibacter sp.]